MSALVVHVIQEQIRITNALELPITEMSFRCRHLQHITDRTADAHGVCERKGRLARDLIDNQEMNPTHYGMADGLPDIATANSYSELTSEGDLYIAGSSRVVKVNIEETVDDLNDLKLGVPYVEVDGTMIYPDENGEFHLGWDVQKVIVYFNVFNYSLTDPNPPLLRYFRKNL